METEQLSTDELLTQIEALNRELAEVREEKTDLEIMLETITEHATTLENKIYHQNKQMRAYIQEVEKLTAAAVSVENNTFQADNLDEVAQRDDELGYLVRVFIHMVQTVKTREEELATAKEQLEAILNAVPGSISWIDSGGLYIGVNRYLAENFNLSQDAFIGKDVGFLKGTSQFAEFMRYFLANPQESASQIVKVSVHDAVRYYLIAAQKYQQGTATVSVGIDVTEGKKAEEALRIAEENYRSIFENALEGIFQSTPDGKFISLNPAMARIYGYGSPQEMLENVTNIGEQLYVHKSEQDNFYRLMTEQKQAKDFEYQAFQKDGSTIWIEINARLVRDNSGKIIYFEGIVQDITERKFREQELKRQLEELKIEIDQKKREKEVALITQSGLFQELQAEMMAVNIDDFWS
ncbi:PAS domain S-box protein [Limnofasciculus baicalensis]|uniref:histidine kinase n=1 Tax=Limnofasciculus baicalensis BBK-W-15 TaxID=2699891 RepID=A0AAE3GLZ5_9CYAN|nr:PAS domain S-box protein [Limnofasciculus baicalensis]MCP2727025.1 PAS domain S-box protein [Limnofasciculus baicalensis BBK-W-15]